LCGQIRYEIQGELSDALNCHCWMCRKATGAAFRTRASVRARDFVWVNGEHLLSHYPSSPGETRTFCSVCGSTLITKFDQQSDLWEHDEEAAREALSAAISLLLRMVQREADPTRGSGHQSDLRCCFAHRFLRPVRRVVAGQGIFRPLAASIAV